MDKIDYKSPLHLGYINKYSHNMLHLFNNDANFSAKLLLEPVYSNVSGSYNGHGIHIEPDLAIFSQQLVSVTSDISGHLYLRERNGCDYNQHL